MKHEFTVGQTVYWVQFNRGAGTAPRPLEITRIGRKWVDAGNYRFDLNTLEVDGKGYNLGRVYLSIEEYETEQKTQKAWVALIRNLPHVYAPKGVTLETIHQVAQMLGVTLPS